LVSVACVDRRVGRLSHSRGCCAGGGAWRDTTSWTRAETSMRRSACTTISQVSTTECIQIESNTRTRKRLTCGAHRQGSRRAAAKQEHTAPGVAGPARAVQGWVGGEGGAGGCGRAHRRRRSTLALDPHVCWLRLVPPRVHPTEHVRVRAAHPQRRPSGAWWQWRSPALHSRRGSSARRDGSTRMPVRTL